MAAAAGCARPDSVERYISADDREASGLYRYSIDLSDSTATYDLSFYSRIDLGKLRMAEIQDFPLTVTWTAPSGRRYRETVYFGVFDSDKGSDFYSSQYRKPYRTGFRPVEWGVWDMAVQVNFGNEVPGFRGLGVICKKNLQDGTR
jgi:hypothetical protein